MIFYAIYGDDNTAYLKLYDSEAALNLDIDHQFHSSNSECKDYGIFNHHVYTLRDVHDDIDEFNS